MRRRVKVNNIISLGSKNISCESLNLSIPDCF